ncbi:hypothetical protein TWF173_001269 [Orbilia oligospora]|nr:hypothetical protein TWF173_001269 [Orbilia oligospora]
MGSEDDPSIQQAFNRVSSSVYGKISMTVVIRTRHLTKWVLYFRIVFLPRRLPNFTGNLPDIVLHPSLFPGRLGPDMFHLPPGVLLCSQVWAILYNVNHSESKGEAYGTPGILIAII